MLLGLASQTNSLTSRHVLAHLQGTGGVEVIEALLHPGRHGLLALTNPDLPNVRTLIRNAAGEGAHTLGSYFFLLGLLAPSGLPTWVLR